MTKTQQLLPHRAEEIRANVRRIVACVNALAGFTTEEIEAGVDLVKFKQQRDELQRDAERLNWLESNPRHAQIVIDGKITDCVFYGISCAELVRLRDAIDAAIAKVKP